MVNFTELEEVIEHCRAEDLAKYDQTSWGRVVSEYDPTTQGHTVSVTCDTAVCLAGTYVLMKGGLLVVDENATLSSRSPQGDVRYQVENCQIDGQRVRIDKFAQAGLGLTREQAHTLFNGDNDLDIIERLTKFMRDNPGDDWGLTVEQARLVEEYESYARR